MRQGDSRKRIGLTEPTADGSTHRLDIQALRGVAVILVVLYHADLGLSGGFVGVDAFFVISGYVIAGTLVRELDKSGTINLRRFYARRIRRLMPALALVSVIVLALSIAVLPFGVQPIAAGTAVAATFFAANAYLYRSGGGYFDPADEANPFLHTWSLSIEEQFYFVLPSAMILLWMTARRLGVRSPQRLTSAVFAMAALVSFWWSWQTTNGEGLFADAFGSPERFAFYAPVTRVWEFLVGVLLALAPAALPTNHWIARAMRGLGLAVLLYAALTFDELTRFPGAAAAIPVLATALLIAAGSRSPTTDPLPSRLSGWWSARNGLVWIGDVSYSWYLWHWPAIVLAATVWPENQAAGAVAACTSLLPAWLSKRWVEDPIRFRLPQTRMTVGVIAAVCLLAPAAAGIVVRRGASADWGVTLPAGWSEPSLATGKLDCHSTGTTTWPADRCTVVSPEGQGLILLLGDSHAASASDGVARAAERLGMNFGVWSESGCPLLLGRAPHDLPTCSAWQAAALSAIDEHQPAIVVIASRSTYYTRSPSGNGSRLIETRNGQRPASQSEALASWEEGLEGLLDRISNGESPPRVLLIANVPEYPQLEEFFISLINRSPTPPTADRVDFDDYRKVFEVEARAVDRFSQTELFDPADVLCDGSVCRAGNDSEWWYRDGDHLNARGSLRLADPLTARLRKAAPD